MATVSGLLSSRSMSESTEKENIDKVPDNSDSSDTRSLTAEPKEEILISSRNTLDGGGEIEKSAWELKREAAILQTEKDSNRAALISQKIEHDMDTQKSEQNLDTISGTTLRS